MYQNKTFLAIIPARGGSKRLPRKNILDLNGKPLIAYSIEAGLNSKYIDKVIVSSDDEEILNISKEFGVEIIKRPGELASDTTTSFDAIKHTIENTDKYDYIILLQPTSPIRTSANIDESIELLGQKDADAIASVCEMDHSPLWSNTLDDSLSMNRFLKDEVLNKRSQDLEIYYRLNGAIYICDTNKLLEEESFFVKENIFAYVMDRESSIDIDEEIDFNIACSLIAERNQSKFQKKIVYSLVVHKLSNNDKKLFNFNTLGGSNFVVETVDLSQIIHNQNLNDGHCDIVIDNLTDFRLLIKNNDYFIINFNNTLYLKNIFDILQEYNKNYYIIKNSQLPINIDIHKTKYKQLKSIAKKIFYNPTSLRNFFYIKTFPKLSLFIFGSGDINCNVSIPSFEYDKFNSLSDNTTLEENYHVFLDQNLPFHRDFKLHGRYKIFDPKNYYKNLNFFFNMLEVSTNKKVKIALHPRTEHSSYNFGNREVFINNTAELVANADIVLGHYSSAISYPVLFNKKLLLLNDNQIKTFSFNSHIETFSNELNIKIINIDNIKSSNKLKEYFNTSKYQSYICKYIKISLLTEKRKFGYEYINENLEKIIKENI